MVGARMVLCGMLQVNVLLPFMRQPITSAKTVVLVGCVLEISWSIQFLSGLKLAGVLPQILLEFTPDCYTKKSDKPSENLAKV